MLAGTYIEWGRVAAVVCGLFTDGFRDRAVKREDAILQLEALGRERVDLSPLCDIWVDLLKTWIASEQQVRKKPGRPPSGEALSNAERQRRYRERRRGGGGCGEG